MARQEIVVTGVWVQISATTTVISIEKVGEGKLLLNDVAADLAAMTFSAVTRPRKQIMQNSEVPTFVRSTGTGWVINVDDAV